MPGRTAQYVLRMGYFIVTLTAFRPIRHILIVCDPAVAWQSALATMLRRRKTVALWNASKRSADEAATQRFKWTWGQGRRRCPANVLFLICRAVLRVEVRDPPRPV